MAEDLNEKLANAFVTLQANTERLGAGEVIVVQGVMKGLEEDIVRKLQDNPDMTSWRKARYNALLSQTRKQIASTYEQIQDRSQKFLTDTANVTGNATAKIFEAVHIPLQSVAVTDDQWEAIAKSSLIQGNPAAAWWSKQDKNLQAKFLEQMRIGYASGESVDQLIQRVRGTPTGKRITYLIKGKKKSMMQYHGGIMDVSRNQAAALVRTAVQQIASDARMEMLKKNADILKGVMWLATLDMRTTLLCASRSGKLYTLDGNPIGHDLSFLGGPPAHFQCYPGYSNLQAIGKLQAVYRRWYKGQLVVFKTASGPDKSVTPNHPVLTLRGWVPANGLVIGDKIIKRGWLDSEIGTVCADYIENKITKAHKFSQSGDLMGNFVHLEVPTTPEDFHDEAVNKEVADVWANYDLFPEIITNTAEHIGKDNLLLPNFDSSVLNSSSESLFSFLYGRGTSTGSSIGISRECLANFWGGCGHSGELLFAPVSGLDTKLSKTQVNAVWSALEKLGYSSNAYPRIVKLYSFVDVNIIACIKTLSMDAMLLQECSEGSFSNVVLFAYFRDGTIIPVHLDDVIDVKFTSFSGHVYNLQCSSGAIFLEDTLTHNCRSTLVPVTKSFAELQESPTLSREYLEKIGEGTQASMHGSVPDKLTFDSWFNKLPEADQKAYLGPRKWDIWKKAGLNFPDLVDQSGNPLTIEQLASAYGVKIKKAAETGIPNVPKEIVSAIAVEHEAQLLASKQAEEIAANKAKADFEEWENIGHEIEDRLKDERTYGEAMLERRAWDDSAGVSEADRLIQYKSNLVYLRKENATVLAEMREQADKDSYLARLEKEFLEKKYAGQIPIWNMPEYRASFYAFLQDRIRKANSVLEVAAHETVYDMEMRYRIFENMDTSNLDKNAPTYRIQLADRFEKAKEEFLREEKDAKKQINARRKDPDFSLAYTKLKKEGRLPTLKVDVVNKVDNEIAYMSENARRLLADAANSGDGSLEFIAYQKTVANTVQVTDIEAFEEYKRNLEEITREFARKQQLERNAKAISERDYRDKEIMEEGLHIKKGSIASIEEAAQRVNVFQLHDGERFQVNCQRCIVAYEMQRRGYDVSATPKPKSIGQDPVRFGREVFYDYFTGKNPTFHGGFGNRADKRLANKKQLEEALLSALSDGGRVAIFWKWPNVKAGHTIVAERQGNKIIYADPQTGIVGDAALGKSGRLGYSFWRMDDKILRSEYYIKMAIKKGSKKK